MSSDSDYTCMIRHHTHKRKKVVISDSDSSDESLVIQTRRKKKILRVVSEGESSSDDSDLPKPVIRRQNHRVISEDESNYNSSPGGSRCIEDDSSTTSEWESDWSSSNESEEDTKKYKTKRKVLSKTKSIDKPGSSSSTNANINSESSDDQSSEKCPICLLPFRKQQVGTPSVCDHCFCLECLLEWSKNINTCPVDRSPFTSIIVREHFDGKIIKELPVEIVPRIENQMLDDPTFCEICHQSDREDRMLLCDDCDRGYHMECLTPPMTTVPIEEWYCPGCSDNARTFVSNFIPTLITPRNSGRFLREIRRNLSIFRNILPQANDRAYVPVSRAQTAHHRDPADVAVPLIDPNQPSTSSGLDSIGDNSRSRSPNTSLEGTASSTRSNTKSKTKTMKRKKKKLTKSSKKISDLVREVRIKEYNNDGEEEEIVTYVKVASSTSRRKCKKRTKKTRKV